MFGIFTKTTENNAIGRAHSAIRFKQESRNNFDREITICLMIGLIDLLDRKVLMVMRFKV